MDKGAANGKNSKDAYRFHAGATLPHELERLVKDQLRVAVQVLESEDIPSETAVHEARKSFKRARSALRVARYALPDSWRELQQAVGAVARELSAFRDADALISAVDKLKREAETSLRLAGCEAMRAELVKSRREHQQHDVEETVGRHIQGAAPAHTRAGKKAFHAEEERAMMIHRRDAAAKAQGLIKDVDARDYGDVDGATLGKGLRHIRKQARTAMRAAHDERTAACMHEWRKNVKHYWYAAQLFGEADAVPVKTGKLKELAELLGDHHDLDLLRARAMEHADAFPSAREALAFVALIDQREHDMERHAFELGAKLLGKRPKRTAKKLEALSRAPAQLPLLPDGPVVAPRSDSVLVVPPSKVSPSSSSSSIVSTGVGSPDSRRGPALEVAPS